MSRFRDKGGPRPSGEHPVILGAGSRRRNVRTLRAAIDSGVAIAPAATRADPVSVERAVGSGNATTAFGVGTSATGLSAVAPGGPNHTATGVGASGQSAAASQDIGGVALAIKELAAEHTVTRSAVEAAQAGNAAASSEAAAALSEAARANARLDVVAGELAALKTLVNGLLAPK